MAARTCELSDPIVESSHRSRLSRQTSLSPWSYSGGLALTLMLTTTAAEVSAAPVPSCVWTCRVILPLRELPVTFELDFKRKTQSFPVVGWTNQVQRVVQHQY
jgi:hypothetical protein